MKKIIFSLLMIFCVFSTVKADNTGIIEINGTTIDKTYEIYKIFDLTYNENNVAYTIDSDWEDFFTNSTYIVDTNNGSLNQITVDDSVKYINITDENIEEFTKEALEYATSIASDDVKVATDTTLTFDNLALGYYLVYPQGATDLIGESGSICSITSTLNKAIVNIKATYPKIDKTADDQNVEVGQLVTFTIKGKVPLTTGFEKYIYKLEDTMTSGLLMSDTFFEVKFGNTVIDIKPNYKEDKTGFTIEFDMTEYQDYVGSDITVTYKALVTSDAVNSDTTNNSVTLTYSNNPKTTDTTTTIPIEVKVYSSLINVIKVDASDESIKLANASFVLKNSEGKFYQAIDSENQVISNTNDTSNVDYVNWVTNQEEATLLVTLEDGIVSFYGLENGTYYLTEVEAPAGYNKLASDVLIKLGYNEEGTNLEEKAVSHDEIVLNNSGVKLPETGGIGTTLFIIIGSILVISSVVIFITNKRISKEY